VQKISRMFKMSLGEVQNRNFPPHQIRDLVETVWDKSRGKWVTREKPRPCITDRTNGETTWDGGWSVSWAAGRRERGEREGKKMELILPPIIKKEKTTEEMAADRRREAAWEAAERQIEDLCAGIPGYEEPRIVRTLGYTSLKNKG